MTTLNTGAGLCHPTHQLSIRPVQAVLELGALANVIHAALNHTTPIVKATPRIGSPSRFPAWTFVVEWPDRAEKS